MFRQKELRGRGIGGDGYSHGHLVTVAFPVANDTAVLAIVMGLYPSEFADDGRFNDDLFESR